MGGVSLLCGDLLCGGGYSLGGCLPSTEGRCAFLSTFVLRICDMEGVSSWLWGRCEDFLQREVCSGKGKAVYTQELGGGNCFCFIGFCSGLHRYLLSLSKLSLFIGGFEV